MSSLANANVVETLTEAQLAPLGWAFLWIALSLVAAAYNLTGFSAVRVPLRQSLLVQLAIGGLRVLAPSAVSTPLVATRFLTRSGASLSDAMATVSAAQGVQLLATAGVVGGLAVYSGEDLSVPAAGTVGVAAGVTAVLALAVLAAVRSSKRVRAAATQFGRSAVQLVQHAAANPTRTLGALLASAALTLTHVLAFAACVSAAGGHASVLTLAGIYLGAATAGTLVPTPGGLGGAEAALVAGLLAAGAVLAVATAATVLSRMVAVWIPAIPGWWAMVKLRRQGLL